MPALNLGGYSKYGHCRIRLPVQVHHGGRHKYLLLDSGVGKSTLLGMFVDNHFREENQPTLGVEFAARRVEVDDKIVKLQIWDTVRVG